MPLILSTHCISTTMSKVLELLMLRKINSYLYTTDNQFGFKQNHGTDMCIIMPGDKPSTIINVTLALYSFVI